MIRERAPIHGAGHAHDGREARGGLWMLHGKLEGVEQPLRVRDHDDRPRIVGQSRKVLGKLPRVRSAGSAAGHPDVVDHEPFGLEGALHIAERADEAMEAFREESRYEYDPVAPRKTIGGRYARPGGPSPGSRSKTSSHAGPVAGSRRQRAAR